MSRYKGSMQTQVRGALRLLRHLIATNRDDVLVNWFLRHPDILPGDKTPCRTQYQAQGALRFIGQALLDIGEIMDSRKTQHEPKCPVCGNKVGHGPRDTDEYRVDAKYCSNRCRQKAYRKRKLQLSGATGSESRNDAGQWLHVPGAIIAPVVTMHSEAAA